MIKQNAIPSAVYVIDGGSKVKVGRSRTPEHRLKQLVLLTGERLVLKFSTGILQNASVIEVAAHKILQEYRGPGEWFEVSADVAIQAVQSAMTAPPIPPVRHRQINVRLDGGLTAALDELVKRMPPGKRNRASAVRAALYWTALQEGRGARL